MKGTYFFIEPTEKCNYLEMQVCLLTKSETRYEENKGKDKQTKEDFHENGTIKKIHVREVERENNKNHTN